MVRLLGFSQIISDHNSDLNRRLSSRLYWEIITETDPGFGQDYEVRAQDMDYVDFKSMVT